MSLVIALAASKKAIIGADRRSIAFFGECPQLEEELYSGQIRDDRELLARAGDLGAAMQISDGREKVWQRGDILVGEVTEISASLERRRRIYIAPGASLQVEVRSGKAAESDSGSGRLGGEARISAWGGVGCTVFGNRFTQKLAAEAVSLAGGRVDEALIKGILIEAGKRTASVSREHTILCSNARTADARADLMEALVEDCKESGWRICAQQ
jgi:hypothetical protein